MEQLEILKEMCRSCLENAGTICIFDKEESPQFSEMLLACASITVIPGEHSPEQLCAICVCRLKDAFSFRNQCQRSEARLRELLNLKLEIKPENITNDDDLSNNHDDGLPLSYYDDNSFNYDDELPLNQLEFHLESKHNEMEETSLGMKKKSHRKNGIKKEKKHRSKVKKKDKKSLKKMRDKAASDAKKALKKSNVLSVDLNSIVVPGSSILEDALKEEILMPMDFDSNTGDNKTSDKTIEELYFGPMEEVAAEKKKVRIRKGQFICDTCGKCLTTRDGIVLHIMTHSDLKPYKCETCGKHFKLMLHLKNHSRVHQAKRFFCDVCGAGLKHRSSLEAHRHIHTGEKPFTCALCGKAFRGYDQLNVHKRTHHNDKRVKKHACEVCGKCYYEKRSMLGHMRTHTGEQPYACSFCPRRFMLDAGYRAHMKIHQGKKDFHCPHCPKTFNLKATMLNHVTTHSDEKAFECPECHRSFKCRQSLKAHGATHSQTKDFVCNVCDQRFQHRGSLSAHRRKKHNIMSKSRFVEPVCAVDT